MEGSPSQRLTDSLSQELINPHRATQPWSYHVPAPPRIVVPPPLFAGEDVTEGRLKTFPSALYSGVDLEVLPVLKKINYEEFFAATKWNEWKYSWRRQAQKILPFLYLGPLASARDKAFLSQEGITLLLAVRNTTSAQAKYLDGTKIASELGIMSCSIDVPGNHQLQAACSQAVRTINAHIGTVYHQNTQMNSVDNQVTTGDGGSSSEMAKVLVYCESGNDRSAIVVVAYLLTMFDLTSVQAMQLVSTQRFCANFDDAAKTTLVNCMEILTAKRDVLTACINQPVTSWNGGVDGQGGMVSKGSKRALDDGDDVEMEDAGAFRDTDEATLVPRRGLAPFQELTRPQ
ncbi:MAG: hypothetical protein M1816_006042 [Peltula sp. TS41687]|nr:MAG: hypothetical protein M1816_006042 [Peltula sp. TS41687]